MDILNLDRHAKIVESVRQNRSVRVANLAASLNVSEATIRRDLGRLEAQGLLRRARGGAIASSAAIEQPIAARAHEQEAEKERIGRAAADLVGDGDTIILAPGTTTFRLASHLAAKRRVRVITNDLRIAHEIARQEGKSLIVLGGEVRDGEQYCSGYLTEHMLAELRADKAFIGTFGISVDDGLSNADVSDVATKRAIIDAAREVIILADHSKFAQKGIAVVAPIERVNLLITDTGGPAAVIEQLRERGIDTLLV